MLGYDLPRLHFSFSYDDLISKAIKTEAFLRRDQAELQPRGITITRIDAFSNLRNQFIAIPNITSNRATTTFSYNTRDAKCIELMLVVNEVNGIVKITFTKTSEEYKSFNIKGIAHLTPEDLIIYSNNVGMKAAKYLTELELNGLTTAMLSNIVTLRDELNLLISAPDVLVTDSNAVTVLRHNTANLLFDEMRNMCEIGTVFYAWRNALKKADYYIYTETLSTITRKGILKSGKTKTPKSEGIKGDTVMKIKVELGKFIQVYFSMIKGTPPPYAAQKVVMNAEDFTQKTASQLGFDLDKGIIYLNIYNPNMEDTSFMIKWDKE